MTLFLPIGIPGSGKSYFGTQHFLPTEIVSSDHYRGVLTNDEGDQSATQMAFSLCAQITSYRLRGGLDVYYDATNLKARFWPNAEGHAIVAIVMDADLDECYRRNEFRGRTVPREAMDRMAHIQPDITRADFIAHSNTFNREDYR